VPNFLNKSRAARMDEDAIILVLADENPKIEGTQAHERFARYRTGMTVRQAKEAGITPEDLRYDREHKYICAASGSDPITVLVDKNPKKKRSQAHARFNKYVTGMTVRQVIDAGVTVTDLKWDCQHNYIQIG
jgi:hypothetical protein